MTGFGICPNLVRFTLLWELAKNAQHTQDAVFCAWALYGLCVNKGGEGRGRGREGGEGRGGRTGEGGRRGGGRRGQPEGILW